MPRTIRYHLDEHCDLAIAAGLRLRGIEVTTTQEAGLLHASDEEHLDYARNEGRVIFNRDSDFLKHHAAGVSHQGIVFCHQDSRRSLGEIIRGLELFWEIDEPDEMINRIEFI